MGVSKQTIYRHIESGDIEAVRFGKTTRVLKTPFFHKLKINQDVYERIEKELSKMSEQDIEDLAKGLAESLQRALALMTPKKSRK